VKMRFAPEDEKAAARARERLVTRFAGWLEHHPEHGRADPWDADLLLEWKWAYADGDYGCWTRADVDDVLLDHLPRKLSASAEDAASIPVSTDAFMRFLDDEGLLDQRSEPADVVGTRALAQQRAFADAMADPANFGMAKRLFAFAGLDPDEPPDQATLGAALERLFEEDLRRSEEFDLARFRQRPWHHKLLEGGAHLVSRIL